MIECGQMIFNPPNLNIIGAYFSGLWVKIILQTIAMILFV